MKRKVAVHSRSAKPLSREQKAALKMELARMAAQGAAAQKIWSAIRSGYLQVVETPELEPEPLIIPDEANADEIVQLAVAQGKQWSDGLDAIRSAFERGDQNAVLGAAQQLLNLSPEGRREP